MRAEKRLIRRNGIEMFERNRWYWHERLLGRAGVAEEIQKTSKGSIRRVTKLTTRLKRLQELNPDTPLEKLIPIAAGQIIA